MSDSATEHSRPASDTADTDGTCRDWSPFRAFVVVVAVEVLLSRVANTTWEWDAVTRAQQAHEIVQNGPAWHLFHPGANGVWLPLWQYLLAGLQWATRLNPLFLGELVSALAAGATALYVAALAQPARAPEMKPSTLLLLSSGCYVAYASQAMTESFAVALFVAGAYHALRHAGGGGWAHALAASLTLLLHGMTRYEGWMFAVLAGGWLATRPWTAPGHRPSLAHAGASALLVSGPTLLFAAWWCFYNRSVTGHFDGFSRWIFTNNDHDSFWFYRSIPLTGLVLIRNLLFACGLLWLFLPGDPCAAPDGWRWRWRTDERRQLFTLLAAGLALFFVRSAFTGYNSGWVRHFLYLHPLSVAAVVQSEPSRLRRGAIIGSVALGVVSFAENLIRHVGYMNLGAWPGNGPLDLPY